MTDRPKLKAKDICHILAMSYSSPFFVRRQLAVVPNVSWSMLPWEADLIVMSKAGYLTEVEIKISMSDWKADFSKYKHQILEKRSDPTADMIKYFYYAAPEDLAKRYVELSIPERSGILSISGRRVEVLKPAVPRVAHRPLTPDEQNRLLRLAAIKAWGLFHKPEQKHE